MTNFDGTHIDPNFFAGGLPTLVTFTHDPIFTQRNLDTGVMLYFTASSPALRTGQVYPPPRGD